MSRIVKFEAENFKRLKAVEITPDEHTVVIAGRNAQGKSSVLDAIMAALAGKRGAKDLVRPVRDGETKARVAIELEDLIVERKWTPSGSTVTVSPKGTNAKLGSPQAVLDKLIGSLSFDPLAFANAHWTEQNKIMVDLIGADKFARIAESRKAAYDNRTEANREVKRLQGEVDSRDDAVETQPVDVGRLSIELEAAIEVEGARTQWDNIEAQIASLRERQEKIEAAAKAVVENVSPRASEVVRSDMRRVDETNRAAQRWIERKDAETALTEARQRSLNFTEQIEAMDAQRADLMASANLPIEGLALDDDGVTYHGVPFVQASAAERLKVSVAMAMALNPDLRVICIRDASLLDDDSKRALMALAAEHDYQIWYEVVGSGGDLGVVIEDGMVAP